MAAINLTIDGKKVIAKAGMTILEAALQSGIFIPHLCYDPELTNVGSCRMCVVEAGNSNRLVTSCTTPVSEGLEVRTATEQIITARKTLLELLLKDHPDDCLTCQKAGNCKLASYAYYYGVRRPDGGDCQRFAVDETSPAILRDPNKCILCGKCVRVCKEIQGRSIMDFIHRGSETKVAPAFDMGLGESDCVSCGSCVAVCPVGALVEKNMIGKGRPLQTRKVQTTCPYCGCGCNFDLNVVDGRVVGITSNEFSPVNGRHLCVKGRFGYDFIHHPDRLTTPLIRKDGELVPASWDEALDLVAERFASLRDEFGGDALGCLTSARCTNEESYLLNRLARTAFFTNNIDNCARL